jgi:hypothetical protein
LSAWYVPEEFLITGTRRRWRRSAAPRAPLRAGHRPRSSRGPPPVSPPAQAEESPAR